MYTTKSFPKALHITAAENESRRHQRSAVTNILTPALCFAFFCSYDFNAQKDFRKKSEIGNSFPVHVPFLSLYQSNPL